MLDPRVAQTLKEIGAVPPPGPDAPQAMPDHEVDKWRYGVGMDAIRDGMARMLDRWNEEDMAMAWRDYQVALQKAEEARFWWNQMVDRHTLTIAQAFAATT